MGVNGFLIADISTIIVVIRKYVSRLVLSVTALANNRYWRTWITTDKFPSYCP